jgi:epoxyqueuosine reductase
MTFDRIQVAKEIKALARRIGFTDCGIIPAHAFLDDTQQLQKWLRQGMHGGMSYMESYFEKRIDPSKLVPGAKSVIVVTVNYFPSRKQKEENENLIISKYAYGLDYHDVIRGMMKIFLQSINQEIVACKGRVFIDSAPILERAAARLAGVGWIGKNTNLISRYHGSFLFIGELIIDVALGYDQPISDFCGTCTRCIDACPTQALIAPHRLDSRLCISYWTIEHKSAINAMFKGKFKNRIFGCDICQDVCPWNRKAKPGKIKELKPSRELLEMRNKDWRNLTEEKYNQLFHHSALARTGFNGLTRNIAFVSDKNNPDEDQQAI